METDIETKTKIQRDIRELAKTIHDLSLKHGQESLVKDLQDKFLCLSVDVSMALDIPLQ